MVYGNLCKHLPAGSIRVLTATHDYQTDEEIAGWQAHDAAAPYPVERVRLLRPRILPPPRNTLVSVGRLLFSDVRLYARVFMRAAALVRRHRINVVCVGELVSGGMLGLMLKKIFGVKLVVYVHGEEITTVKAGRLHGNSRRRYLAGADKIVAVSSFACDALTGLMGVPPERVALIRNGVDTQRFAPADRAADLIERHGLQGKTIILSVGRLVPRKGMDMTIRAMKHVYARNQNCHYLIVGEGGQRAELERIVAEEGVAHCVTLVGAPDDSELVRYYQSCDIFIMANRTMPDGDTEGFGLVFLEANACKKPVIGGRAGGAVEAVLDHETGYLVDGHDPHAIAQRLLLLADSPALRASMGEAGFAYAQRSDVRLISSRFVDVCERLLRATR